MLIINAVEEIGEKPYGGQQTHSLSCWFSQFSRWSQLHHAVFPLLVISPWVAACSSSESERSRMGSNEYGSNSAIFMEENLFWKKYLRKDYINCQSSRDARLTKWALWRHNMATVNPYLEVTGRACTQNGGASIPANVLSFLSYLHRNSYFFRSFLLNYSYFYNF